MNNELFSDFIPQPFLTRTEFINNLWLSSPRGLFLNHQNIKKNVSKTCLRYSLLVNVVSMNKYPLN